MPSDSKRQIIILAVLAVLSVGFFFLAPYLPGAQDTATTETDAAEQESPDAEAPKAIAVKPLPVEEATLETIQYIATLSSQRGHLKALEIKGDRFKVDGEHGRDLITTDQPNFAPLQLQVDGTLIEQGWQLAEKTDKAITFKAEHNGYVLSRKFQPGKGAYQLWVTTKITNTASSTRKVRLGENFSHYIGREDEKSRGLISRPSSQVSKGICANEEDFMRETRDDLDEETMGLKQGVKYAGVENQYFASVMVAQKPRAAGCKLESTPWFVAGEEDAVGSIMTSKLIHKAHSLGAGESTQIRTLAYLGPKDTTALRAAGHGLEDVIDLGWFKPIGIGLTSLLRMIHRYVGNWGFSIMLLTIFVRVLLLPLTAKSFQSMAKMRKLKPEIDRINELYSDDAQKKGAATMELWKKEKVNPVSGCLPMVFQMPIWFALYQSIYSNVELYHQPFFGWWNDLSAPDPFFILPVVYGGLMFVQQSMMPSTMDETQRKIMMYVMPIGLTVFLLFLPLGLGIYMVTQSVLGISQQKFIHWRLDQVAGDPSDGASGDSDSGVDDEKSLGAGKKGSRSISRKEQQRGRA